MKSSHWTGGIAGALLSLFGLLGCSRSDPAAADFIRELTSKVQALAPGQDLRMDAVNTATWTRLFVFAPYTTATAIQSALGTNPTPEIERARIGERDDIHLLVFQQGDVVQLVAEVPRGTVDFSLGSEVRPLARSVAVFRSAGVGKPLVLAAGG